MTKFVHIHPCSAIDASIRPPGSKSITNRAILCAALAAGKSQLSGVLDSEDTQVMISAWQQLGLAIEHDKAARSLSIEGCGGKLPVSAAELHVGNSGTTIRFLAAALAACHGSFRLDGVGRMRQRPIGDLIRALSNLGADITSCNPQTPECPPIFIRASGLRGGKTTVAGNMSSQFLSGLMMAAVMADADVILEVEGELVSVPYVQMTAEVMRSFGAMVSGDARRQIEVSSRDKYVATNYAIEPDASAASYFWGAAAITGGKARVLDLSKTSLQGDVRFCQVLAEMGCNVVHGQRSIEVIGGPLKGVDVDMADISDTVQTLAAVAMFATGTTVVRGVAHNRVKETDRISDLACELRRLGAGVDEFHDGMAIHPPLHIKPTAVETYRDHRMAMSLALVGLRAPGISILDPDCTAKTYPEYWQDLARFTGCRIEWGN